MPAANPWKSYKQIATQTAPPGQLVLMLYEAALRSLECALTGFAMTDPGERNAVIHNNLQRALDIIRELNLSLNFEAGGELASTLSNLYYYFDERLNESNLKKSREGVDAVISHMVVLRDAWAGMLANQGQPQPPADGSAAWANSELRAA